MNIHEYQSKEIFAKYGIPVQKGFVGFNEQEIKEAIDKLDADLWVVKAQIHAGGRGKAGGVKLAKTRDEARKHAKAMLGMTLVTHQTGPEGQKVGRILITEGADIAKEYYLSLVVDRSQGNLAFIASAEGGVDIEEVAAKTPEAIIRENLKLGEIWPFQVRKIGFAIGLRGELLKQFVDLALKIHQIFLDTDADQIEVNPLVVTKSEQLLALDAKVTFDDNALFRHKDICSLRDRSEEDPLE